MPFQIAGKLRGEATKNGFKQVQFGYARAQVKVARARARVCQGLAIPLMKLYPMKKVITVSVTLMAAKLNVGL